MVTSLKDDGCFSARLKLYTQFVAEGMSNRTIWRHLNRQIYLGDDVFVQRTQANLNEIMPDENVPGIQARHPALSLSAD